MSNIPVGQSSAFAPAVLFHNGKYHMVFAANNDSRELLHAVSNDGTTNWTRLNNLRQSTNQAPALFEAKNGILVCVFTANNSTNTLLSCNYEDGDDNWTDNTNLGEASNTGPVIIPDSLGGNPLMFWLAANSSNDILVATI
jgi:predicted GH43/DUF377 family glycosyl hydrolase